MHPCLHSVIQLKLGLICLAETSLQLRHSLLIVPPASRSVVTLTVYSYAAEAKL